MQREALEGVRILDISTVIAGPFGAGILADLGAEVIKVEMPGRGDTFRNMGAPQRRSIYTLAVNGTQQEKHHTRLPL